MATQTTNYLDEKIDWQKTANSLYPYMTNFQGKEFLIRLNDFPAEHLYTLIIDGTEAMDFDDWSINWKRPVMQVNPQPAVKTSVTLDLTMVGAAVNATHRTVLITEQVGRTYGARGAVKRGYEGAQRPAARTTAAAKKAAPAAKAAKAPAKKAAAKPAAKSAAGKAPAKKR